VSFRIPAASAYAKFRHPASRYAVAAVYVARFADGVRVAVTGAGPGAFRWSEAEAALTAQFDPAAIAGLELDDADLSSDIHASAEYRAHLCGVMLAQAVRTA
jgi:carbon-monoxide dehydrogenase medium subunit